MTDDEPEPRRFADVTAVERMQDATFRGEIDPGWTIMGKPNGGYLVAMMARAACETSTHDHVIASSAHFLRSPKPGPVRLEVETLREGRLTGQSRVRLLSDDVPCVESLVTIGPVDAAAEDAWSAGVPDVSGATFEQCHRLPSPPAPEMVGQVDLRLEERSLGFAVGRPAGVGELWGWLALPQDQPFDPVSLHFALDAFPPATFDIEMSGWVPTLELTTYVRGLPAPGPVQVLQKGRLIRDSRVDEACFVWDTQGRLVASGTQLAMLRSS